VRRDKLLASVERALLGAGMSLAALLANWILTRRMAQGRARSSANVRADGHA
jgi:hypothetical protein